MRKIIQELIEAAKKGQNYKKRYVELKWVNDSMRLYLWDQLVALEKENCQLHITDCGQASRTYCFTINGFLGVNVKNNKKEGLTLNGKAWNGTWREVAHPYLKI